MINSRNLRNKLISFLFSVKRFFANKSKITASVQSPYRYTKYYSGSDSRRPGRPSLLLRPLLIAVSALMLFSLSSCGSQLPRLSKDKPVMITIWHHYLGEQKVSFDNLVTEFNSTIGPIQNNGQGSAWTTRATSTPGCSLRKQGARQFRLPEIATAYPSTAYTLYNMGKLIPLINT